MEKKLFCVLCLIVLTLCFSRSVEAFIVINEILADPAVGIAGDANGDGVTSSTKDEFIELFNNSAVQIDLSFWSLSDKVKTRHVFPEFTSLSSFSYMVIFAGGNPQLEDINWQLASSNSLGLNNSGDTVSLFDAESQLISEVVYGSLANKNPNKKNS